MYIPFCFEVSFSIFTAFATRQVWCTKNLTLTTLTDDIAVRLLLTPSMSTYNAMCGKLKQRRISGLVTNLVTNLSPMVFFLLGGGGISNPKYIWITKICFHLSVKVCILWSEFTLNAQRVRRSQKVHRPNAAHTPSCKTVWLTFGLILRILFPFKKSQVDMISYWRSATLLS